MVAIFDAWQCDAEVDRVVIQCKTSWHPPVYRNNSSSRSSFNAFLRSILNWTDQLGTQSCASQAWQWLSRVLTVGEDIATSDQNDTTVRGTAGYLMTGGIWIAD